LIRNSHASLRPLVLYSCCFRWLSIQFFST